MECFGKGVIPYLYFDLTLSSQNLLTPVYSVYQQSLYNKILSLREKGMNYVEIANWLNKNNYKTTKGRVFSNNHVHSIVKKRRSYLEIMQKKTNSISVEYQIAICKEYSLIKLVFKKVTNFLIVLL